MTLCKLSNQMLNQNSEITQEMCPVLNFMLIQFLGQSSYWFVVERIVVERIVFDTYICH